MQTLLRRGPSGWTVRAHLALIAIVFVVVFLAVGLVSGRQVLENARGAARASVTHAAGVAGEALGDRIELGRAQATALAANPGVPPLFVDPTSCQLAFDLDLLPAGRLDFVRPDGTVVCSSSPDATADTGPAYSFRVPVRATDGADLGWVAFVAPTDGLARRLTEIYGGRRGVDFVVVDGSGAILTAPPALADERASSEPVLDAAGLLAGSAAVPGTDWRIEAGIDPSTALASTRSVLLRGVILGGAVLLVLLAALAVVNRRIARPLRRLTTAVSLTGPRVGEVVDSLRAPTEIVFLAEELRSALAAHEAYETQLAHQALHDPLTGLPNRALLTERLTHSLEQVSRAGRLVTVLFLDLDRFKVVNDSLGHAVGDEVLVAAAARLDALLRPGDTLARFGGDEFVIVGEAFEDAAKAERFAERLLAAVDRPIDVGGASVRLSASVGIAVGGGASRAVDLIRDADTAMYMAKERGRGRLAVFDTELRDRVTARLTTETELRDALVRDQLRLDYQPKIDLLSGTVVGVEALLRWDHPELGMIAPGTFIPIAEDTGLIVPIGDFVVGEACRQVAAWRRLGVELPVSINVSGRQLADPTFRSSVSRALTDAGIDADRLSLELTESLLLTDALRTAGVLQDLRGLGVRISIDNFGTGYSSLAYLHRFPIDELKIDQIFVHDLADSADQRTLVRAMVAMGHALGLDVVANGVESDEQARWLLEIGCGTAQGYRFATPQPPAALEHLLDQPLFAK